MLRTNFGLAMAARQIVLSMVRSHIEVSVDVGRVPTGEPVGRSRAGRMASAVVLVEMIGPAGDARLPERMILAKGEANAWCSDEIANAARRAAERIMRRYPAWRCLPC